jgi:hypothetical protein
VDLTAITEVMGLAGTAAGATGKATETILKIKSLFEGGGEPERGQAEAMLNTLAAELTAANMMNVQISTALKQLSSDMRRHDEFEVEKARYELFETPSNDFVYKLIEGQDQGQPSHFICPVCLTRDRLISIVRPRRNPDYKICQTDDGHMYTFGGR